jgi:argininosuccinate lyase
MIATAAIRVDKMKAAADSELLAATDIAEWLVGEGMPFREAHAVVGGLVQRVIAGEGSLHDLVLQDARLGSRAAGVIAKGVRNRTSPGGAGPVPVARQFDQYCEQMNTLRNLTDL